MKRSIIFIFLFCICTYAHGTDYFELVRSKNFRCNLLKVTTSTMNEYSAGMNLQADVYEFYLAKDSLFAYVPFVGYLTNPVPDAITNAIQIEDSIGNFRIRETKKKKKIIAEFDAYSKLSNEKFFISLTVSDSGLTDVVFKSRKRSTIIFSATVSPLK